MKLRQTFDHDFDALLRRLRDKYPQDLFKLEGIHPDQTDIGKSSAAFFRNTSACLADASVDANANVSGRNVITYVHELPKPLMRLNALFNLWKTIRDMTGTTHIADEAIKAELTGLLYINDSCDIGRPYCFNFSCLDIARNGLKMDDKLVITPPKHLATFLRQLEQFAVVAANSVMGATGYADLLIVVAAYVEKIRETGRDNHVSLSDEDALWAYVREQLVSLVYTFNWVFRGHQSPFTNVSVYDEPFLMQLTPSYEVEGFTPAVATVQHVQEVFLDVMNSISRRTPLTFPVVTACFSVEKDKEDKRHIRDRKFLALLANKNREFGFINIYCGETSTISSCCRLRSDASDLGYSNSFGSGATKIGSLGVVTLNLPALALESGDRGVFLDRVAWYARMAGIINEAKRHFIRDRIRRGALPLYTLGFMELERQYSTCGFCGLYEALEILGCRITDHQGRETALTVLSLINKANALLTERYGTPHNMEQVPAETAAVKLAAKDRLLGRWNKTHEPEDIPAFYANQFIPLWDTDASFHERLRIQGELDALCTGGAICHLNVAERISDPAVMANLIEEAVAYGVVYFAVNYQINRCPENHMSVGRGTACPVCGKKVEESFTRVVGFNTSTKNWNSIRRNHDWPGRHFYPGIDSAAQVPETKA